MKCIKCNIDILKGYYVSGIGPYCMCCYHNKTNKNSDNVWKDLSKGWICPRCGKVISPHIKECNRDFESWEYYSVKLKQFDNSKETGAISDTNTYKFTFEDKLEKLNLLLEKLVSTTNGKDGSATIKKLEDPAPCKRLYSRGYI